MTDVDGQALTLESVRAALAADVERDAQSVLAISNTQNEYSAAVERARELHAELQEQYAQVAAKPYLKDKLAELGITEPARLVVTIGGARKAPAKKAPAAKKAGGGAKSPKNAEPAPNPPVEGANARMDAIIASGVSEN